MIEKVKKYGIIVIMAILFTAFSFSIVDVVMEPPRYEDFCRMMDKPYATPQEKVTCPQLSQPSEQFDRDCMERGGYVMYDYDTSGCATSFECNTCQKEFDDAGKQRRLAGFIIMGILGVVAIIVGMYAAAKSEVVEWIYSGLLIGGILSVCVGTMWYFHDMGRFVKPFILAIEMGMIVWIAIRTAAKHMKRKK